MRVSTSLLYQRGINAILDQQSKSSKTQIQLSTGKRLLSPSDDPAGSKRLLDIKQAVETTGQYQKNIDTVRSRLTIEESTLDGVTNFLQRARELAVNGANGTHDATNRKAIGAEARQILEGVLGLANAKNANGEYVFSGDKTHTKPFDGSADAGGFSYQGDSGQRSIRIGPTRLVADSDSGENVFGAAGVSGAFDVLYAFANNMDANISDSAAIDNIDGAIDRILNVRSSVGARLNALDKQKEVNADFELDMKKTLSEVQDLDFAEAISQFNQQNVALQAAQQAYVKVQNLSLFNYL
ncbi:MAG: flagellar hook-associated protein FlgL [Methylococcales bacterium]